MSDGLRRIPAEIVEKVIDSIPFMKENPAAAALYNYITMWIVQSYVFGDQNELNAAEVLGIFTATIEHHLEQFAPGEIADRVAAQLGRSEEERAFDLDEYWAAVNGVGEMARQTLELVLTDDEKFGDFLEKATQSGAYRPSDDDGQVH